MEPTSTQGTLKLSPLLFFCENLLNIWIAWCAQHFHYPFLKCTLSAFVKSIGNHLTQRIKIIGLLKSICPQRPKQYLWEEIVSKIEFLRGKKGHLWRKFEITSFMKRRCPTIYNFTCLLYEVTKHIHFQRPWTFLMNIDWSHRSRSDEKI